MSDGCLRAGGLLLWLAETGIWTMPTSIDVTPDGNSLISLQNFSTW
jgi:hypothetical protein